MTMGSPLLLKLLVPEDARWQQLSAVGETYGAASAILSAFALVAIGFSLFLQAKEMRLSRSAANRAHHLQLMQLQMTHPVLRRGLGLPDNGLDPRLHIYLNLVMSHWEAAFVLGEMSERVLIAHARNEFFSTSAGGRFWESTRDYRRATADDKAALRFVDAIDDAWRQSRTSGPDHLLVGPARPAALNAAAAAGGRIWDNLRGGTSRRTRTGPRHGRP